MQISDAITKLRTVIQDNSKNKFETFIASGTTFTIAQENVEEVTSVTVNGNSSGINYSYEKDSQTVIIADNDVSDGDSVVIYFNYTKYSDTELGNYIEASLFWMDVYNYSTHFEIGSGDEIEPEPTSEEKNLIIIVASILIAPDWNSYKTATVQINYSRTMTKDEKIEKIISKFMFSREGFADILNLVLLE
jgi:hypothetical protein